MRTAILPEETIRSMALCILLLLLLEPRTLAMVPRDERGTAERAGHLDVCDCNCYYGEFDITDSHCAPLPTPQL